MSDLEEVGTALADAITAALPAWVQDRVERAYEAGVGAPPASVRAAARAAGLEAALEVGGGVRALLSQPLAEQRTTPLALLREAVRFPTAVLRDHGVPTGPRDNVDTAMFPDDVYGLTPARFAELGPRVAEAGVAWGAAKAWALTRTSGHDPGGS